METARDIDALPRRLTQAQIIGMLLTRGSREHSSVALSRNAKGETQVEVTVRTGESDEIDTVDAAAAKAAELYDQLRRRFPLSSGYVGAEGPAAK
jgi:hypothetical protein